ncbi:hypothetical protein [Roseivirga echinicomitans]|uniref:Uncharacterized protein n=1 Tax=Roseivirga echinicomitans TaxID=296218 RepID=A0A150XK27_9BACT|nr:hypothetical protein [Roseivirga echinicomitans]KYG79015.1 hypothetical protein AWN68_05120 [Roseivirga echinicomitans]
MIKKLGLNDFVNKTVQSRANRDTKVKRLKFSSFETALGVRDNSITIEFPNSSQPEEYHLEGLTTRRSCAEIKAPGATEESEARKWLQIGDKKVVIKLRGNMLKFPDKFFGFELLGGSLTIDLEGGTIDCGLQVAQAQNWCNLSEPDAELELDNARFFKIGDNICSSFPSTNSTAATNYCFLENAPTGNKLTGFKFKDDRYEGHPIIPRNAYVSNGCIWGGEAPTFKGHGEVIIKNGFVQEGLSYFIFTSTNESKALNISLDKVHFSGQFLDGLIMGSNKITETPFGNINADITDCYFGKSYDIAKQGIVWNSIGNLTIKRCHFARGNHDPDIYQDIELDTQLANSQHEPGNIDISDSVFDGQRLNFLDYDTDPNPYLTGNPYITEFGDQFRFMYLKCLSAFQIRYVNKLKISNCLFENYERQMILTQLTKHAFLIGSIEVNDIIHSDCPPLMIDFLLPGDKQSDLLEEIDDSYVYTEKSKSKYLTDLSNCYLGKINFNNCIFEDVGVDWAVSFQSDKNLVDTYELDIKDQILNRKKNIASLITFNNSTFVKREPDTRVNGMQTPNQTVGNQIFNNTTIINYTRDTLYFGVPSGNNEVDFLSIKGDLTILRGKTTIRQPLEEATPHLMVNYFHKNQLVLFDTNSSSKLGTTKMRPWWDLWILEYIRFTFTCHYQYESYQLNNHRRIVHDFEKDKKSFISDLENMFDTM